MLTFHVKKKWFEKIKSGEKTHEYRKVKDYWIKRMGGLIGFFFIFKIKKGHIIRFSLGYPPKGDKDKILYSKVIGIRTLDSGISTDYKTDEPVFDIKFELIKE